MPSYLKDTLDAVVQVSFNTNASVVSYLEDYLGCELLTAQSSDCLTPLHSVLGFGCDGNLTSLVNRFSNQSTLFANGSMVEIAQCAGKKVLTAVWQCMQHVSAEIADEICLADDGVDKMRKAVFYYSIVLGCASVIMLTGYYGHKYYKKTMVEQEQVDTEKTGLADEKCSADPKGYGALLTGDEDQNKLLRSRL